MNYQMTSTTLRLPTETGRPEIKRFPSAERAWLWAASCLAARRAGQAVIRDHTRPCSPDAILRHLDNLYRARRIDLVHARVLRHWGSRGCAPPYRSSSERSDWRHWVHALGELEHVLRARGIVSGFELAFQTRPRQKNLPDNRITFLFKQPTSEPISTKEPEIMEFSLRNLSVLAYANGFTLWHYRAGDAPLTALDDDGFFTEAADLIAPGDIVMASGTAGARMGTFTRRGEALALAPM